MVPSWDLVLVGAATAMTRGIAMALNLTSLNRGMHRGVRSLGGFNVRSTCTLTRVGIRVVAIAWFVGGIAAPNLAHSDPYFNSSEAGCSPTGGKGYVICDDFNDGNWAVSCFDCEAASQTAEDCTNPNNDGWNLSPGRGTQS